MSLKKKLYKLTGKVISKSQFKYLFRLKDDNRKTTPFTLVFFCGRKGIEYLNASLISVYKYWDELPPICIVSDGTPKEFIQKGMLKWPRKVDIITWEDCALHMKSKGNEDAYKYASTELWGRKFAAIHYCAEHFPSLYSDTDVLWYASPKIKVSTGAAPFIKMSQDVHTCYTEKVIAAVQEERCLETTPLNAGLLYAQGEFSTYPKWKQLCNFLAYNLRLGGFSEQTANAILNNHFNPGQYFNASEILIKIEDEYSLRYTGKDHPGITARHYVSSKKTCFWRDFAYMIVSRKKKSITSASSLIAEA